MTKSYPSIGSVSHATMRPEDLIPSFLSALDGIKQQLEHGGPENVETVARLDTLMGEIEGRMNTDDGEDVRDEYFEGEECMWDLESLEQELNNHAPPYCYFGASEGDGSDYGFWFCGWESIEEDIANDEVMRLDAGAEWPEDEIRERVEAGVMSYVVEVNERGNITLYTPDHKEIWSLV